jgi:DNA-binding PadR family transcriptional regulator
MTTATLMEDTPMHKVNDEALNDMYDINNSKPYASRFKAEYSTLFPTKMSSSNFIQLYTLYLLSKTQYMYGKQILNELISVVSEEVWKPSHGTLYPLLALLQKDGFIEVAKIEKVEFLNRRDNRIKKYYSITEKGREELDFRLEEFKNRLIGSSSFFKTIVNKFYSKNI